MPLELAYYGHPVLRRKADPIASITDKTHRLVQNMIETMYEFKGGGLAAPQVQMSQRLFIIDLYLYSDECKEDDEGPQYDPSRVTVFINPRILNPSEELCERPEGCLSIPGIRGNVIRPDGVTVEAMDLEGNWFSKTLTGWQATAVMHENDHLNGVLYIDRMQAQERKKMEPHLRSIKQKYYKK